ncbi:GNAT family N-acetyltransferase [Dyadobacter crusticola]|uniref:GNAT family N-acetyltransferase n=1 Tax=Dyadobacter crusticola TaxID=292407 RepID=UPI0004E22D08|nr:GNAT family N-acetyltransferase [Dyadobacter crusticola]
MEQYTLTIPAKEDYPELTDLWEASVRATHHFLPESDILFFRPLVLNEYLAALQLICIRDTVNGILGFCGVSGETVEMLFVHPDQFGKRIGKVLMQHALQNGARKVDVNEQNPDALAFYQHLGFKIASRSPFDGLGKPYPILHLELP